MPNRGWQAQVGRFVAEYDLATDVPSRTLDLTSEVGELCKEVLAGSRYGKREFAPTRGWAEELGDVLFALACLAERTEVDLELALEASVEKLRARLKERGDPASGPMGRDVEGV